MLDEFGTEQSWPEAEEIRVGWVLLGSGQAENPPEVRVKPWGCPYGAALMLWWGSAGRFAAGMHLLIMKWERSVLCKTQILE